MEFLFSMVIVLLMIYALIMIFRWTGLDLVGRRQAHENKLVTNINENYGVCNGFDSGFPPSCISWVDPNSGPMQQLDPYFYKHVPMNAVWGGGY